MIDSSDKLWSRSTCPREGKNENGQGVRLDIITIVRQTALAALGRHGRFLSVHLRAPDQPKAHAG